jgi:hypothetical protein
MPNTLDGPGDTRKATVLQPVGERIIALVLGGMCVAFGVFMIGPGARMAGDWQDWVSAQKWHLTVWASPGAARSWAIWSSRAFGVAAVLLGGWVGLMGILR